MIPTLTQLLHLSRTSMLAQLQSLDTTSNNLANVNTNGFKGSRDNFQELLSSLNPDGARIRASQRLMAQGAISATSNALDLAVNGQGFFGVRLADGRTAYTRDGQFTLDAQKRLVNVDGNLVVWNGQIPQAATEVHVNKDGAVMVLQGNTWSQAGVIPLHRFDNPSGLLEIGQNNWLATPISGEAQAGTAGTAGFGSINGYALERSNVNLASEMTQLMSLEREFQLSTRTFQASEQMLVEAIDMRR
jgi:flagellar basal-body rod protein FlgG